MAIENIIETPQERPEPSIISPGDLPWATVLMPTTSSGHSGVGVNRHGLKTESWVFGFFADGDSCQQPMILGVIPAGPGAATLPTLNNAELQSVAAAQVTLVGDNNSAKVFNFFVNRRFTPEQAAGISGCLYKESNLNPLAFNSAGGGSGAFGLAQWRGARLEGLTRYATSKGTTKEILQTQLEYIMEELLKTETVAYRLVQQAKNPTDAAIGFAHFERGEDYSRACYTRYGNGCPTDQNLATQFNINRRILLDRIKFANSIYEENMKNITALGAA